MAVDRLNEKGMVTAETAVIAPFGALVVVTLLWLVSLGLTQIRLVDAARDGARLIARGDPVAQATAVAARGAPDSAQFTVDAGDGLVTVRVSVRVDSPVPGLPGPTLSARSVVTDEE